MPGCVFRCLPPQTLLWACWLELIGYVSPPGGYHYVPLVAHLLGFLLSQRSLLLDLLLFVDGDVRVSLSVRLPLPGCLLLPAHFVVRTPGFIQLQTK